METIGICKGCEKRAVLMNGACSECLKKGEKWAQMAHRCRTEPEFAKRVYNTIPDDRENAKKMFIFMFGVPEGCVDFYHRFVPKVINGNENPSGSDKNRPNLRVVK